MFVEITDDGPQVREAENLKSLSVVAASTAAPSACPGRKPSAHDRRAPRRRLK